MTRIAITQNVVVDEARATRLDTLDQRWWPFLAACGLSPVILPNQADLALALVDGSVDGVLLTGGNDLAAAGGPAAERDDLERRLLARALERHLPVLGVCRGMQLIQDRFGIPLRRIDGHAGVEVEVRIDGRTHRQMSYHRWGTTESRAPLDVWATAADGVIKAVRHATRPVVGIMWHPERAPAACPDDVALFRRELARAA